MTGRSREHIVSGEGTVVARVLQLLVALVVIGLAAYGLVFYHFSGLELNIFTAAMTVVGCVYLILASTIFVRLYNYWLALAFDCVGFALWITSFALLVSQIRPFYRSNYYYNGCDWYYGACYYKRDVNIAKRSTTSFYTYRNSMGAIAAMAGIEMLIFMATFISLACFVADHRSEGGHALYHQQETSTVTHQSKGDSEMQATSFHEPFAARIQSNARAQQGNSLAGSVPYTGPTTTT